MATLNRIESEVLAKLLAGDHPVLEALRSQLIEATVRQREMTGAGFVTRLAVPDTVPRAPVRLGRLHFGDVEARVPGLKYGAGFVLFISDGLLERIEGYSYEEPWPQRVEQFELNYSDPARSSLARALE